MFGNNNFGRRMTKCNVAQMRLIKTGTYNPMYSASYNMDTSGVALSTIPERAMVTGVGGVKGEMLAGVTCDVLRPSVNPNSEIIIPNGWLEQRVRFILEVHCSFSMGNDQIYYFQGYTSYPGVSDAGHIAPDMEFILNSYIAVTRTAVPTAMGMQVRDTIAGTGQFLSDNNWQGTLSPSKYLLRPVDIFNGFKQQYASGLGEVNSVYTPETMLRRETTITNRNNNVATSYLAKILSGYQHGMDAADYGMGNAGIVTNAVQQVYEELPAENPFIKEISNNQGRGLTNRFFLKDLIAIDPTTLQRTDVLTHINTNAMPHTAGQTSYWNGTDRSTLVAITLANAVPALMLDLFITQIAFTSHNHDYTGAMNSAIVNANALTNVDMSSFFRRFIHRLEKEVLNDLTYGNQERYTLSMTVDINNETRIKLALNGGPEYEYTCPTFCDSLITPVVSPDKQHFDNIVSGMDHLVNFTMDTVRRSELANSTYSPSVSNAV